MRRRKERGRERLVTYRTKQLGTEIPASSRGKGRLASSESTEHTHPGAGLVRRLETVRLDETAFLLVHFTSLLRPVSYLLQQLAPE